MIQLPASFETRLKSERPSEATDVISSINESKQITSVRLNPKKNNPLLPTTLKPVSWSKNGYYLPNRPSFITDPLWHAGVYYVQEASSMLLEQAINQHAPKNSCIALDLCASPGGKTTHLASLLSDDSLVLSNEVIRARSRILAQNVIQWGYPNVIVSNNDPDEIAELGELFDIALVDAPCSGEGLFRKDPRAIDQWSPENVSLCSARQKRIISDAWQTLKPNGLFIYSTCTFSKAENENNLEFISENFDCEWLTLKLDSSWNIKSIKARSGIGYACYPGIVNGEGFFIAVARKLSSTGASIKAIKKVKKHRLKELANSEWKPFIKHPEDYFLHEHNNSSFAVSKSHAPLLSILEKELNLVKRSLKLGEVKGKNLIPSHELALSTELEINNQLTSEITLNEAFDFLKKAALSLNSSTKGIHLLTFNNQPIGWVKHLGNRTNNLFPSALRVLKQFDADKLWTLTNT